MRLAIAPGAQLVLALLAAISVLLFLAASWTGRWSLWVGAYTAVLLALAGIVLLQEAL